MLDYYIDIFSYHHQFNKTVIEYLEKYKNNFPEKCINWMSHILYAHEVWILRVQNKYEVMDEWTIPQSEFVTRENSNYKKTIAIIQDLPLKKNIKYKTSRGIIYVNSISEILFHICNHTAHHRGMIIAEMRNSGIAPPVTDYIFYKRI
ncbi:DinB family protein [Membranihabitans maritimus]|uniref:DinB family protein n=1 Tax=Membranihabitans maritimus TaxID=2904244 RepID=UPI001F251D91|nr:DinB family protein [Membranihabitans maritimus]